MEVAAEVKIAGRRITNEWVAQVSLLRPGFLYHGTTFVSGGACETRERTAGPSTALRSGRDDNSVAGIKYFLARSLCGY